MKSEVTLTDSRLIDWLKKQGIVSKQDLKLFLNPAVWQLNNPFLLEGISQATKIISDGIKQRKRFAIVGDYDCDGIMSSTILYQFFKFKHINCKVFIPNRFEDGYGLNNELSDHIIATFKPDILITVDLGISCVDEIAYLQNKGVKVIVTDHHEPQSKLPDCVICDPKIATSNYPFKHLCGAGVAFKLVSAVAGNDFANKFFDILAIATIGDIVPLLEENRVIAKLGINNINNKVFSLPSVKYLLEKLELNTITETDISLKVVPKINASGRMDNAQKVFDFLNTEDKSVMKKLLAEILADNEERLLKISEAMEDIDKKLLKFDVINQPIICVKGEYHQGILGILSSRIVNQFNRPSIVFTKTENGTYKGSGRSVKDLDIHSVIEKYSSLLVHFGGHKLAIGLEVREEEYDNFVTLINAEINNIIDVNTYFLEEPKADILITPKDISLKFINQLYLLSPFGCANPKPCLAIKTSDAIAYKSVSTRFPQHIKLNFQNNCSVIYFNGKSKGVILDSQSPKTIYLDLEYNNYNQQNSVQGLVKNVASEELYLPHNNDEAILSKINLYCKYFDSSTSLKHIKNLSKIDINNNYGTIIFADNKKDVIALSKLNLEGFSISSTPNIASQNCVVINSYNEYNECDIEPFKNIIFCSVFGKNLKTFANQNVYYLNEENFHKFHGLRSKCAAVYNYLKSAGDRSASNIFDYVKQVKMSLPYLELGEIIVILYGLKELQLIEISKNDNEKMFGVVINQTQDKTELNKSKILNKFFKE